MENEASTLSELEADFHAVVNELLGDQQLERFRQEYERLYQALLRSHGNEQLLIKKCKQLRAELVANAESVSKAMHMTEDDQNSILLLQKEVKKAWKRVSQAADKETQSAAVIKKLKAELNQLQKVVTKGCGLTEGQETTVNELLKVKAAMQKELNAQNKQLKKSNEDYNELFAELEKIKMKYSKNDEHINQMKIKLAKSREDLEMNARRAERSENQLSIMNQIVNEKKAELKKQNLLVETLRQDRSDLQTTIGKLKLSQSSTNHNNEKLEKDLKLLQEDLRRERDKQAQLKLQKDDLHAQLDKVRDELRRAVSEGEERKHQLGQMEAEQVRTKNAKKATEETMQEMRIHFDTLKSNLKVFEKRSKEDAKTVSDLTSEIARLATQLSAAKKQHVKNQNVIGTARDKQQEMQSEIDSATAQIRSLRKLQKQLERQVMKDSQDQNRLSSKNGDLKKLIETYSSQLEQAQEEVSEEKMKLRHQQALYEKVRGERNDFCQKSIEAQDQISQGKQRAKILSHQVQQNKEEISVKDSAILKQHIEIKSLLDEREMFLKKISKKNEILGQCDKLLEAQDVELNALRRTISDIEKQQKKQKLVFDTVADERDILSAQCIRRNDEIALLNEKIRVLESTLNMGEVCYNEKIENIKSLKLQSKDLQRQLTIRNSEVKNMKSLKQEVCHLQKDLLHERTKCKALGEEIQNPVNVHRWRKLEGSDPESYEMIQKIQTLQKRLIEKTEEVVEKDLVIEEKERLYVDLKNILARQPGPEVAEQLVAYQQTLKERTRQMKACAAELNMCQAQVNEYKYEMERLVRELADTKKKYYEQKKKEQLVRDAARTRATTDLRVRGNGTNFVGGGFAL